jgi:hypothetical protein
MVANCISPPDTRALWKNCGWRVQKLLRIGQQKYFSRDFVNIRRARASRDAAFALPFA